MSIQQNPEKINISCDNFTHWLSVVAQERKNHDYRYYKINQRAVQALNLPNLHFYIRSVKIANFRTGGNVSRQFQYFGGRWKRAAIYKNLARLESLGYIRRDPGNRRAWRPVPGKRRHYVNAGVLKHVRSRQDTLYLKFLLFIVNYAGNFDNITHRTIKAAGFAANTAEFLYTYIKEHLNKSRLEKLYNAVVWAFRLVRRRIGENPRRVIAWIRGRAPVFKFRSNVPKWRKPAGSFNYNKDLKSKTSNAPPWNGGSKTAKAEPAENPAGHPDRNTAPQDPAGFLHFGTLDRNLKTGALLCRTGIEKKAKSPRERKIEKIFEKTVILKLPPGLRKTILLRRQKHK